MAKPVILPEWATDDTYVTAPSEGQQETGYNTAYPHRGHTNWLFKYLCEWAAYLDAAQFDAKVTATQGFEAAEDEHVIVSSGGRFAHSALITNLPVQSCVPFDGFLPSIVDGTMTSANSGDFTFEVPAHAWRRLTNVYLDVKCATSGVTWQAKLYLINLDGISSTLVATSGTSSGTLNAITELVLTPATQFAGRRYVVQMQRTAGAYGTFSTFGNIRLVYDVPTE